MKQDRGHQWMPLISIPSNHVLTPEHILMKLNKLYFISLYLIVVVVVFNVPGAHLHNYSLFQSGLNHLWYYIRAKLGCYTHAHTYMHRFCCRRTLTESETLHMCVFCGVEKKFLSASFVSYNVRQLRAKPEAYRCRSCRRHLYGNWCRMPAEVQKYVVTSTSCLLLVFSHSVKKASKQ